MLEEDHAREVGLVDSHGAVPLSDLVEGFAKTGVPDHLSRRFCRRLVQAVAVAPAALIAKGVSLLLGSTAALDALVVCRSMPRDRAWAVCLMPAIRQLPTADRAFDREVVLAACWHGAADSCLLYVDDPLHAMLALEVVAHEGVDPGLKTAVADRCVQLLASHDDALMCAALRCLVGIGEVKRISLQVLVERIARSGRELRNCIVVVVGRMIADGVKIAGEGLAVLIDVARTEELAIPAIVAVCKSAACARVVLKRIGEFPPEAQIRMVLMSMRAPELMDDIRAIVGSIVIEDPSLHRRVLDKLGIAA
jgi:hypothetical protein